MLDLHRPDLLARPALPCYTGSPVSADLRVHDGGLPPAIGASQFQVLRANRGHPEASDGFGYTYHHAPMLAWWRGRFWLQFLSCGRDEGVSPGHTMLTSSADGARWEVPHVAFPALPMPEALGGGMSSPHQRMGFYVSPSTGRLLTLAYYGRSPEPFDGRGLGRTVREVGPDGVVGATFFIRGGRECPAVPPFEMYRDAGFVAACRELLADPLMVQQWWEEERFSADGPFVVTPREEMEPKAFCWYRLPEGRVVGLWKGRWFTVADAWAAGRVPPARRCDSFTYHGAKAWGQRTSDGRYAMVYNPTGDEWRVRYPLAVTTSADGITFDGELLTVHAEMNPIRYAGMYKDHGPQYVRGILPGNGEPPDGALWLTYSVNKEDIWVVRVPTPVTGEPSRERVDDDFSTWPAGPVVPGWNTYAPRWAPVELWRDAAGQATLLRLADRDPADYASATRVFPAAAAVELRWRSRLTRVGQDPVEVDVTDRTGRLALRLRADAQGRVWHAWTTRGWVTAGPLLPGRWEDWVILIDAHAGEARLGHEGPDSARFPLPFVEAVDSVERCTFRTGPCRRADRSRIGRYGAYLADDLPDADEPVPQTVFDLARFAAGVRS